MFTYPDALRRRQINSQLKITAAPGCEVSQTASMPSATSHVQYTGDTLCPITFEPIRAFPRQDVFVTLDGKPYHKQTLMRWLQTNNVLPHNQTGAKA